MDMIRPFETLRMTDVEIVGGKNASIGEMIQGLASAGVRVPGGFATTADAFRLFLQENDIETKINAKLGALDENDVNALVAAGKEIRGWVEGAKLPAALEDAIRQAYGEMGDDPDVAVRSSATAEDLPEASFAGQQETFLNVRGVEDVLEVVEDEQRVPPRQELLNGGLDAPGSARSDAERLGHRRGNQGGVANRRQRDEPDAAVERRGRFLGDLQGQPRLADATRSGQGHEPRASALRECGDGLQLRRAADE